MSRTTLEFSRPKLFLKNFDSRCIITTTLDEPSPTTGVPRWKLNGDIHDLCKKFQDSVAVKPTESLKYFTPASEKEPATVDYNDFVKVQSLKKEFERKLPELEVVSSSLDKLEKQLKILGDLCLETSSQQTTTNSTVRSQGIYCPLLSGDDVDKFFLNYVLLVSLLNNPACKAAYVPLECFATIHQRILASQLPLQKSNKAKYNTSFVEDNFENVLGHLQHKECLLRLLQGVNLSTVFRNIQSYRPTDDRGFNITELKSHCVVGPTLFYYEILRILKTANINLELDK